METRTIVTHSSRFHADDVCAVAALRLLLEGTYDITVVRTRDEDEIAQGDYVVDVGGVYNHEDKRYDHHQAEGAGTHENGIPYAAFGLIWKHYGAKLAGSEEGADIIERNVVTPIDAMDNGIDIYEATRDDLHPYLYQDIVSSFRSTWREEEPDHPFDYDEMFMHVCQFMKSVLSREIEHAQAFVEGKPVVEGLYQEAEDKRIIVMDKHYPYEYILPQYPEPLFVVRSRPQDETWAVEAVKDDPYRYDNRKNLPRAWAGLTGSDLAAATGVNDAIFCHRGCFLAVAGSKEGALQLARMAVEGE